MWLSVWSEVQIFCMWSSWCYCIPKTPWSLAWFKSRLALPFWYRLIQVVLEKRPLNGCSSSTCSSIVSQLCDWIISGGGDARYRTLAESYANLSRDYENLKSQYNDILLAHEDVCAEIKLLKKELLVLQSLVTILIVHVTLFPSVFGCVSSLSDLYFL